MLGDAAPSPGLLSGVLDFVSRELESFVATATGGVLPEQQGAKQPKSTKHVNSKPVARRDKQQRPSTSSARVHVKHENTSKGALTWRASPEIEDRSLSSPPLPAVLQKKNSLTMPGSLFPRSPSILPDENRHILFDPEAACLPPPPSFRRQSSRDGLQPSPSRRSQLNPSVQAAVDRFYIGENDAGPSILLPSPTRSPAAIKSWSSPRDKGKGRQSDVFVEPQNPDTSGEIRVKGKQRELNAARAEQRERETRMATNEDDREALEREKSQDKERIRMLEEEITRLKEELSRRSQRTYSSMPPPPPPPPPAPPPPPPLLNASQATPTSQGEALFTSARAALKHAPPPVERPINPPPVSSRRQGQPTVGIAPDKMAAFLSEMKNVRLRKVSEVRGPSDRPISLSQSTSSIPSSSTSRPVVIPTASTRRLCPPVPTDLGPSLGDKRKRDLSLSNLGDDFRPEAKRRPIDSSDSSITSTSTSTSTSSSASILSRSCPPSSQTTSWPSTSTSTTDATTPSLCSDNDAESRETEDDRLATPPPPPAPPFRNIYRFRGNGIPVTPDGPPPQELHSVKPQKTININGLPDDDGPPQHNQPPLHIPVSPHMQTIQRTDVFSKRPPTSPLPPGSRVKPRPPASNSRSTSKPYFRKYPASRSAEPDRDLDDFGDEDPLLLRLSPGPRIHRQLTPHPKKQSLTPQPVDDSPTQSFVRVQRHSSYRRRLTLEEELREVHAPRAGGYTSNGHDDHGEEDEDEKGDPNVLTGTGMWRTNGFLAHGGGGGVPMFMVSGGDDLDVVQHDDDRNQFRDDEGDVYGPHQRAGQDPDDLRYHISESVSKAVGNHLRT